MELWLVDRNPELVAAWQADFAEFTEVLIKCADILSVAENTIVSPANGYGYMDGGIDLLYTSYFGMQPQENIQNLISKRSEGFLPVGVAVFVETGNEKIPYMISAPTMVNPGPVDASNVFFAMSAILQVAQNNKQLIKKLFCPGLATGTGRVPYAYASEEMAFAYRKWMEKCAV